MRRRTFIREIVIAGVAPLLWLPRVRAQTIINPYRFGASSTLNDGIVAFYKLSEASGTRNDSIGTNHLTDNNTVLSATGIISNAADFESSASEFLSVADTASFGFTTAFSIAGWINRESIAVNQTIFGKWTFQTDGGWALQSGDTSAPDLSVLIATSATDDGTGCFLRYNNADQSVSTWYHIAMVYDGGQSGDNNRLKLYQNATALTQSVIAGAVPASLQNDTADFNIGKFGGSVTRYFDGLIDEVGLWNRALTSTEVTELYNAGAGKTCCPFV